MHYDKKYYTIQHMKRLAIGVSVILLIAFYFFSREVKHGFLKQVDFDTTVRLQDRMPKRFDEMWEDVAFLVTPIPSVCFIGLLTLVAIRKRGIRALLIPLLFSLLIAGEMYGKSVVHHPAPPFFMIKNPTTIFPKYYINEAFSYPSGHTARAVFIGCLVSGVMYHVSRKRKALLLTIAISIVYILLVALGRIYLGHHWLSDILGGGLLGGGLGLIVPVIVF
jgi:membrane-associated phospholipid phosphatase